MNWGDYFGNHKSHYLKKIVFEMLKEKYSKHEQIIERSSVSLVTDQDIKDFVAMLIDIYETAYIKAVKDQKEQLEKLGLVANVK